MIITTLYDGFGNQMFQYAMAKCFAVRNNTYIKFKPCWHRNTYDLKYFGIPFIEATPREIDRFMFKPVGGIHQNIRSIKNFINPHYVIKERTFAYDYDIINISSKNIYIDGLWQCEKYFFSISEIIKNDFNTDRFLLALSDRLKLTLNNILDTNSVCVHIRRGDYISGENIKKFGHIGLEYYKNAIEFLEKKFSNLSFFIFSDDIEWCIENIKTNNQVFFVSDKNVLRTDFISDFTLMSKCKHFIIPNSTFSWWAAWLSSNKTKIVIAPEKWFGTNELDDKDIIPENWIKI